MTIDYKDKIRKLLALAESPVEAEARSALLKARQLMAEHKLSESELKASNNQTVKNILTDISCSKRRNPWIINLSSVIGENYCCKGYRRYNKGKQTQHIGFIGLQDDAELCVTIFKYAVDCILANIKNIKVQNQIYNAGYVRKLCDSYGYGFCEGISEAFTKQQEENQKEWGLILGIPQEVKEAARHLGHTPFKARAQNEIFADDYAKGFIDGKKFDPTKRITHNEKV